jgi:chromosome partitioning protein
MRIIAVVNQKGGCGKTTTAINLSACLAQNGKQVLLIDLDPQNHASIGLDVNVETLDKSMYNVLLEDGALLEDVSIELAANLSLAPSQTILSTIEQKLAGVAGRENRLRRAIRSLSRNWDYVIIDTPPNIGLLTFNALRACREAIVPIDPSFFSLHGVAKLMQTIGLLKEKYQQTIRVKALATMDNPRTKFAREILADIRNFFTQNTYQTTIRNTVKIREATSYGQPVVDYAEESAAAKDYLELTREVIDEEKELAVADLVGLAKDMYDTGRYVLFALESPQANDVRLVGDFNEWKLDDAVPLIKKENGVWQKALYLDPGSYQYKFVVDGKWITDPKNDRVVANAFGESNSILTVEPIEDKEAYQGLKPIS